MSNDPKFSRRRFIQTSAALGAAMSSSWPFTQPALASDVSVGFLYVGPRGTTMVKAKLLSN